MTDDQSLVQAVLAGKPQAFARLIDRHQKLVWHVLMRMLGQREDAEDLAQEVFLRVHRVLPQFRFESSLATWIGQIAFSMATRHLQKKRLPFVDLAGEDGDSDWCERVSDGFDLEAALADAELAEHLRRELDALPALQRTLITLYHQDELGIGEIAGIVAMPEGTVKNYLFRARQRLRRALEVKLGVAA